MGTLITASLLLKMKVIVFELGEPFCVTSFEKTTIFKRSHFPPEFPIFPPWGKFPPVKNPCSRCSNKFPGGGGPCLAGLGLCPRMTAARSTGPPFSQILDYTFKLGFQRSVLHVRVRARSPQCTHHVFYVFG